MPFFGLPPWVVLLKVLIACLTRIPRLLCVVGRFGCISFLCSMGMLIVSHLRELCHRTNEVWKLASICYVLPIAVYVILNIAVAYNLCDKLVSDSFSFGILTGICLKLLAPPGGGRTFRVLVRTNKFSHPPCVVWLPGPETSVADAISAIGERLGIVPSSRISVETGRGAFVTEVDKPLLQQLCAGGHLSSARSSPAAPGSGDGGGGGSKDFFGFTTTVCNVLVRDEEVLEEDSEDEDETVPVGKRPTNLTNLIKSRGPVRWKDDLLLSANVGGADIPFSVGSLESYAAARPPPAGYTLESFWGSSSKEVVHFIPWSPVADDDDDKSDASYATGRESKHSSSTGWGFWKSTKLHPHLHMSSAPLHDGDMIVIASGSGGFMSVKRGWWIAWASAEPRRSGAFVIEIVERAPQLHMPSLSLMPHVNMSRGAAPPSGSMLSSANLAASQAATAGETAGNGTGAGAGAGAGGGMDFSGIAGSPAPVPQGSLHFPPSTAFAEAEAEAAAAAAGAAGAGAEDSKDRDVLNTGDLFRLRSVKFPEYELGITSKKISGDHCYLGLHKAQAFGVEEDENVWCHTTRFSARYSNTIVF